MVQIAVSKNFRSIKSDFPSNHKEVSGYVTGMNNNFFDAIKILKTKVKASQHNGKDNGKIIIIYCPGSAGRRLMTGSILNNLKLEE